LVAVDTINVFEATTAKTCNTDQLQFHFLSGDWAANQDL
jgi:hypothetical protein